MWQFFDLYIPPFGSGAASFPQATIERELGCCLLDIGGGTAGLVVFLGGVVRHVAALPVGGDHFTNDIAVGLRTPIPEAEKIKADFVFLDPPYRMEGTYRDTLGALGESPLLKPGLGLPNTEILLNKLNRDKLCGPLMAVSVTNSETGAMVPDEFLT